VPEYEVFATRWDSAAVIEEVIPARSLDFTWPLSEHGDAAFSATVEPGRSWWRAALSCAMSGILICKNGVPQWQGRMLGETQSGPRTFDFRFAEWLSAFEDVPAVPLTVTNMNDHALQRRLISDAQAIAGQDYGITLGSTLGASVSDLTIAAWDSLTVEEAFQRLAQAKNGPEWYLASTGTFENPTRTLVQGDRLGSTSAVAVLEFVEDTELYVPPEGPPTVTLMGSLFPGDQRPIVNGQRRGGNVIAFPARQQAPGITVATAVGAGDQLAQLRRTATAAALLTAGFPRRTKVSQYTDVTIPATLQRHADGDLAAASGMTTSYAVTTFEDDPEYTGIARGDTVRCEFDTDVWAGDRPLIFNTRVQKISVHVPDDGRVQTQYTIADVQEF